MSHSLTYQSWAQMKDRCTNWRRAAYAYYGGRGIKVCGRWIGRVRGEGFRNFVADMGERPPGTTLERIDNNGNYEPGNCRWATRKEQMRNTRANHLLTVDGVSKPIIQWAEEQGLKKHTLLKRVKLGWTHRDAVFTPVAKERMPQ